MTLERGAVIFVGAVNVLTLQADAETDAAAAAAEAVVFTEEEGLQ